MTVFEKLHKIYGTDDAIAEAFQVTRQAVVGWRRTGIPFARAQQVEKVTKGKVTILDVIKG